MLDNITDWEAEIWDSERNINRPILDTEQIHRLSISWGLAARHMPRIAVMEYHMSHATVGTNVEFSVSEKVTLRWVSRSTYVPDERVAKAWLFDLKDMASCGANSFLVSLPRWPPVAW
jgi:hypothetical protein